MAEGPIYASESREASIGWGVLIAVTFTVLPFTCLFPLMCGMGDSEDLGNRLVRAEKSPDGKLQVVVFASFDKATGDGDHSEVLVMPASDVLGDGEHGNVFDCTQGTAPRETDFMGPTTLARWTGPRSLQVTYDDRSEVLKARRKAKAAHEWPNSDEVTISYVKAEPSPRTWQPFAGQWHGRFTCGAKEGGIDFNVAQFGELFDLAVDGRLVADGGIVTYLNTDGEGNVFGTRLRVERRNRIVGTLRDQEGRSYQVDVRRSGPTRWVAPSS